MTATVSETPRIFDTAPSSLDTFAAVELRARELKPGMGILDDLGTVVAVVDHRNRARHGAAGFVVFDLERHTVAEYPIHLGALVRVAA